LCDQNRHIVGYARSRDVRKGASSSVAGATNTAMTPSPVKPFTTPSAHIRHRYRRRYVIAIEAQQASRVAA
jgi:hypothetical protein